MKYMGEASYVLGIEIQRNRSKGILGLSQKTYIENVLKRYEMHRSERKPTPIIEGEKFGTFQCPKNDYELEQMKSVPYTFALGSIMYVQVCTRPDLALATGLLGRFQSNLGKAHWKAIKRTLRYMQGTKGLKLTYRKTDTLETVGYSDADLACCKDILKSTSRYVFLLAGGAISWKSAKQSVVTSSTMYAEFTACFEATGQAMWLKKFVPGLRVIDSIERLLKIYCDNKPSVFYSSNNKSSAAAKHIELKYYVVKEKV
ncbi:hypothetical protein BS78_01G499800 [Paspalum vaginatum]|nr:hypothetical protein BS78_01G499800 [Paspalum vaginatum]